MTNSDDTTAPGLNADDRQFPENLESDRGLFRQLGDSWRGALGGWAKLVFAFAVVLGALLLFTIWQLAHSHDQFEHAMWAIAAVAVLVLQGFIKEWIFARMNMLTILREVKLLQIQVAALSEKDR